MSQVFAMELKINNPYVMVGLSSSFIGVFYFDEIGLLVILRVAIWDLLCHFSDVIWAS